MSIRGGGAALERDRFDGDSAADRAVRMEDRRGRYRHRTLEQKLRIRLAWATAVRRTG
ncbi:hypothetical protein NSPZN2_30146 [Nitrospira defluvii]|uniref:Transposase n=1 Tax=Nitrospira defluvii TaxID=330214 RepID=A0ABM8RFP8_9BACT|nr:hypothetical protein NSPZN2_30146 [Nitrospira defluvii]